MRLPLHLVFPNGGAFSCPTATMYKCCMRHHMRQVMSMPNSQHLLIAIGESGPYPDLPACTCSRLYNAGILSCLNQYNCSELLYLQCVFGYTVHFTLWGRGSQCEHLYLFL